jgi:histidinol dehydrogenase
MQIPSSSPLTCSAKLSTAPTLRLGLITTSADLGKRVSALVDKLLVGMPTADFAGPAWRDFGEIAVVDDLDSAYVLADRYASEHVQILTENPREALKNMRTKGASRQPGAQPRSAIDSAGASGAPSVAALQSRD